jgi:hypothetical protein
VNKLSSGSVIELHQPQILRMVISKMFDEVIRFVPRITGSLKVKVPV